jgi:hypothetical protein
MMLRGRPTLLAAAVAAATLAPGCMRARSARDAQEPALARVSEAGAPAEAQGLALASMAGAAKAADRAPGRAPGLAGTFAALKLIRTAQVSVEVAKYEAAAAEVARVAETFGGYVAESKLSSGREEHRSGSITIRVPADRFVAALAALKGVGKVRAESVSTQDVTKAYTDLETRLRVKRDTADRLRELLRTRTADLPDVLNAERELARVTEEIEQMEGERRFYDQQVAFSTITLALAEPQAVVEPGVFTPIGHALRDSLQVLAQSLAALVYILVALAPWMAVAYLAWRTVTAIRNRRRRAAV